MCDAARHLSERPQAFLLHHRLLALLEIVVSLLQRRVELRLVSRERDVIAQLAQELAFVAGKTMRLTTRDDQNAEDSALCEQRRDDQCTQVCSNEALG